MRKSISEISRELKLSRNTVKNRIKDGWSYYQIKRFYKVNLRLHKRPDTDVAELIAEIEESTGENFRNVVQKIREWTQDTKEIARSLNMTHKQLKQCLGKVFSADEINKMRN